MISTTSSRKQMSHALRPFLAACILAVAGGTSAWAADPGGAQPPGTPPGAMQGQAPGGGGGAVSGNKEAACAAQAKQQGLKGQQRQQFIQQCMQG